MDTINEIKRQEQYREKVKKYNQKKIVTYMLLTMGCQLRSEEHRVGKEC